MATADYYFKMSLFIKFFLAYIIIGDQIDGTDCTLRAHPGWRQRVGFSYYKISLHRHFF